MNRIGLTIIAFEHDSKPNLTMKKMVNVIRVLLEDTDSEDEDTTRAAPREAIPPPGCISI